MKWYRRAAERGNAAAQYSLGVAYSRGEILQQDDAKAYFWLFLAAKRGPQFSLGMRDEIAQKLDPAVRANIKEKATHWKPKIESNSQDGQ